MEAIIKHNGINIGHDDLNRLFAPNGELTKQIKPVPEYLEVAMHKFMQVQVASMEDELSPTYKTKEKLYNLCHEDFWKQSPVLQHFAEQIYWARQEVAERSNIYELCMLLNYLNFLGYNGYSLNWNGDKNE